MTGLFDSNDASVAASEVAHPYVGRFVRRQGEPRRVCRRPFRLSYAAMAASSSMA